jgi:AhpD family alkylhydroperoxidase
MKAAEEEPLQAGTVFTPAVRELVALGAALACNCEPCLRYHFREARKLGLSDEDIRAAFEMAAMVKQTPTRNASQLAERLLSSVAEEGPQEHTSKE